ncbi:MAG: hypothetical protein QW512_03980 [Thermofilaceae archaeon]
MTELLERCRELGANRGQTLLADGWGVEDVAASLEEVAELGAVVGPEYALLAFACIGHIPGLLDDLRRIAANVPDIIDANTGALLNDTAKEAWRAYVDGLFKAVDKGGEAHDRP